MHSPIKELLTLSTLEQGRKDSPAASARHLSPFQDLEAMIAHSLKKPELVQTQTVTGVPLRTPKSVKRPFQDEALMEKLLRHRDQIPVSARIIRESSSS